MTYSVQQWMAAGLAASLALLAPMYAWLHNPAAPAAPVHTTKSAMPAAALASMAFEVNQGQTDPHVKFVSRGPGYGLFLTSTEAVFKLNPGSRPSPRGDHDRTATRHAPAAVLRMAVVGGNPDPRVEGIDLLPGKSEYFIGKDPAKWQHDVARYGKVNYRQVYDGIDLVYYGNQGKLEYDFVVAPGEDPKQIALQFDGAGKLRLDAQGNLVLTTTHGELLQHKPIVYQDIAGQRHPVQGRYQLLAGNRVGFDLDRYDGSQPLVIDPVLLYSTYLGGDRADGMQDIGLDAAGNIYTAGYTASLTFPWPVQGNADGLEDAFVCKLNPAGSAIIQCGFIGSSGDDRAWAMAVTPAGEIYVAGRTDSDNSTDFPLLNATQPIYGGAGDAFVMKINAAFNALIFSTYLGGSESDNVRAMAVDSSGAAYVIGRTSSPNFPVTAGALQTVKKGFTDAFVAKFGPTGNLIYNTYLGGSTFDAGSGIAVDAAGNAYVSGHTESTDFPLVAARQSVLGGGPGDAFLGKLNAAGSALLFSTYHGGSGDEWGYGIALDKTGNIFFAGFTLSSDFPVAAAFQPTLGGGEDGFLSKFNPAGSALLFSTYVGGSSLDDLRNLSLDRAGNPILVGYSSSPDFPVTGSIQAWKGDNDGTVSKFSPSGKLLYSTFFGGTGSEFAVAEIGRTGDIYVAGETTSTDFPLAGAFQATHASPDAVNYIPDAYIARIGPASTPFRGDFNGDGIDDVLWRNDGTGANILWPSANGALPQNLTRVTDLDWQIVGVGDFNGDGHDDLLWRHQGSGKNAIWKSGLSSSVQAVTAVSNLNWRIVGVDDFDGDGKDDILWRDVTTGANTIWRSGDATLKIMVATAPDPAVDPVGTGDFNGDGKADIVWRSGQSGGNSIWLSANSSTTQTATAVTAHAWRIVGIGDFNSDGKSDLLWRNVATGANTIWRSGVSSTVQAVAAQSNQAWQIVGSGDYNGDGKADILWRNTATGSNTIWRGGGNTTTQAVRAVTDTHWAIKG